MGDSGLRISLIKTMKISTSLWVLCLLIFVILGTASSKLFSPSIDDTLTLGDIISRVKRSPKFIPNLFRILSKAFAKVHGRERKPASLGTADDMPTEIRDGAETYVPKIENPLLLKQAEYRMRHDKNSKSKHRSSGGRARRCRSYDCNTRKQPKGDRHIEGLRPEDAPGCGFPICTIVDMRVKSFKSMCHLVEWMVDTSKFRQVFEIQKGSCIDTIKKRKTPRIKPWATKPSDEDCKKCSEDKTCNRTVCVNDKGHAKSFSNFCEANLYLSNLEPKKTQLLAIALGECKSLYKGCIFTEWFDLDNPADKGDHESVGQVFNYLAEQNNKHVHRSCSMKNIHYPVCLQTTQGHGEVEGSAYTKSSHSVECMNYPGLKELDLETQKKIRPAPPYYWDIENVTCRDWKIRYCCENLWGEPGLYGLLERKAEKPVPEYISETDVFVDKPTRKTLFEDCRWRDFVSMKGFESDLDLIYSHTGNGRDVCYKKKGKALYIDARVNNEDPKLMIPWDETSDELTKVSPLFGVYCDYKNNGKRCQDYKYRLCCAKKERKNPYGQWSKWSECEGKCGPNNGKKKRMRKCFVKRPNCMKTETGLFAFQEIPCTKPCEGKVEWDQ